jgi:methyl-accepting chemotaxis protein
VKQYKLNYGGLQMRLFYNMKIGMKLIVSFILVAILAGVVGIVGIVNIKTMDTLDTELYEKHTSTLPDLANVARAYQRQRTTVRNMYIDKDSSEMVSYKQEFDDATNLINTSMERFKAGIVSDEVMEQFNLLAQELEKYNSRTGTIISLLEAGDMGQAYELLMDDIGKEISQNIQTYTDNLMNMKTSAAQESSDKNSSTANIAINTMIAVVIAAVIVALALGIFISNIISRPIRKIASAADMLALGDVNATVAIDTKDEIGSLAQSFRKMIANIREQALVVERIAAGDLTVEVNIRSEHDLLGKKLSEMLRKNNEVLSNISLATEQVAIGSRQVSDSSIALSQGATEQASSVEELTASLEEISSQTELNAKNANQANELAVNAKTNAVDGNNQMKEMLRAMEDINESSSNIYKIIKVIDDIAFQTNILALNAAVEAARAGQHGKGFAVVAEEVRTLAARSANAAKETTDMIEGSMKKAEGGTRIAKKTADALNSIVNEIEKVASLVNNIAIASNEQAIGIGQINQGIMQVSQVVQTNSATSEETAAASEELASQADLLKEEVSKFTLKRNNIGYGKNDEISPEVLAMLKTMTDTSNSSIGTKADNREETTTIKSKIILSDKEFGKY